MSASAIPNFDDFVKKQSPPAPDFASDPRFNTKLTPSEELGFRAWKQKNAPKDSGEDYDLRGAYKADLAGQLPRDDRGHTTDKFKKPNHPTFSDQSQYHGVGGYSGGKWGTQDGKDTFTPSDTNLKNQGESGLRDYFSKEEPEARLIIPAANSNSGTSAIPTFDDFVKQSGQQQKPQDEGFGAGLVKGSQILTALAHPLDTLGSITGVSDLKDAGDLAKSGDVRGAAEKALHWLTSNPASRMAEGMVSASGEQLGKVKESFAAARKAYEAGDYAGVLSHIDNTINHLGAAATGGFTAGATGGVEALQQGNTGEGAGMIAGNALDVFLPKAAGKVAEVAPAVAAGVKAGAKAAAPEVIPGLAKVGAGAALAEVLPGGPIKYAFAGAPAYAGARQMMRGVSNGVAAGRAAYTAAQELNARAAAARQSASQPISAPAPMQPAAVPPTPIPQPLPAEQPPPMSTIPYPPSRQLPAPEPPPRVIQMPEASQTDPASANYSGPLPQQPGQIPGMGSSAVVAPTEVPAATVAPPAAVPQTAPVTTAPAPLSPEFFIKQLGGDLKTATPAQWEAAKKLADTANAAQAAKPAAPVEQPAAGPVSPAALKAMQDEAYFLSRKRILTLGDKARMAKLNEQIAAAQPAPTGTIAPNGDTLDEFGQPFMKGGPPAPDTPIIQPAQPEAVPAPRESAVKYTPPELPDNSPDDAARVAPESNTPVPAKDENKFSSTQVNLPEEHKAAFDAATKTIADADLAEKGRETDAHITLKFGIHGENPAPIQKLLKDEGPITAKLGKTSIFETPKYDVVKIDVDSPELHRLNKVVSDAVPHTDTHPEYQPHVTLAYVAKGEGAKYVGKEIPGLTGKEITFNDVKFSDKGENHTSIPLEGKSNSGISEQPAQAQPEAPKAQSNPPYTKAQINAMPAAEARKAANELRQYWNDKARAYGGYEGHPAMGAAHAKDLGIADYLRKLGVDEQTFKSVSPALRKNWGERAGYKAGVRDFEDRTGPLARMLKENPPSGDVSPSVAEEVRMDAQKPWTSTNEKPAMTAKQLAAAQALKDALQPEKGGTIPSDVSSPDAKGQEQQGGAGSPVQAPSRTDRGASGAETRVEIPGENRGYQARYAVRELADIQSSHNGHTFQPNPKYGIVNDRDYTKTDNKAKVVDQSSPAKFNPAFHITDNPDMTNGPPAIDSQGNAAGGNGRLMGLQRVYATNPKGVLDYRNMLEKKASQFGIDPAIVRSMKEPVLVREIPDEEWVKGGSQSAVTDLNKTGTAALRPSERAIADSRRVSVDTLDHIAGKLEDRGPDATLANVLEGKSGAEILNRMISDGVISPQERAAYAQEDILTPEGKSRISRLMLGRFFRDPAQLDTIPPSVKNKLERVAAPLARVESSPEWNLSPIMKESLDLIEEGKSHGAKDLNTFIKQNGLFGNKTYSADAVALAKKIQNSTPTELVKSVRQYASDASYANSGENLFGDAPKQPESFAAAFR